MFSALAHGLILLPFGAVMNYEFVLRKAGRKLWQCRVVGCRLTGAGSRPDLAIRDWKAQVRLWGSNAWEQN